MIKKKNINIKIWIPFHPIRLYINNPLSETILWCINIIYKNILPDISVYPVNSEYKGCKTRLLTLDALQCPENVVSLP